MTVPVQRVVPPAPAPERGYLAVIARGAFFNLAGSVTSAVSTLAFSVVVTRTTRSKEQAGIYFALSSVFVLGVAISRLGVPMGLVYFLSRARTTGDQRLVRPLVRQAGLVVAALALALGVVGVAAAAPIAEAFAGTRSAGAVLLVRVLSCCLVFAALTDVGIGATRGLGSLRPLVLVDQIGRPLAQLLLAIGLGLTGATTALGLSLVWVLPWVPSAVVALVWADRLGRRAGVPATGRLEPGEARAFWRFTGPRSLGSVAQLALQRADILLIGVLRGPRDAAVYTAATRFLVFGQLLSNAIGTTIQPKLAQLLVQDDRAGARAVYRAATGWLLLTAWPVFLLSAVFPEVLLAVFGKGYDAGSVVIVVLSLVSLVATATGAVDVVLAMAGRATWTMANVLVALAVDLVLNVLLIPPLGILGAALAWAAAIVVNNVVPLVQLMLALRLHPFGRATVRAGLLALACFGALPLLVRLALGSSLPAALLAALAGGLVHLVLVYRWRGLFELHLPRRLERALGRASFRQAS